MCSERDCKQQNLNGGIPELGWEQSGGESVTAVAGTVYRFRARRSAGARSGRTVEFVSCGGCEGRHKAGTYGDLMALAGRGLAGHFRLGTCHQYRHPVDQACCRRGGVAGAEPPHKGGPNRPDRPELQWLVVSGQRRRLFWGKLDWELTMACVPPEVYESSPPFWDAPI